MAYSGKIVAKRYWGLSKEEFQSLRGTEDYRALLRHQIGITFETSVNEVDEDDYNNMIDRIRVWCEHNCTDNYYIQKIGSISRFFMFVNENDMVAFKLFWDGMPYNADDPPNV